MQTATAPLTVGEADKPMQRITLDVAGVNITVGAADVLRLLLDRLRAGAAQPPAVPGLPRIGQPWPEQGGIYAGLVRGDNGAPDYHLIVAERSMSPAIWKSAVEWAKDIIVGRFNDYTLPKRKDQSVLFGNVPELFEKEWYWSCEEHSNTEHAWVQNFDNGRQDYGLKTNGTRARAVRRVPIS